MKQIDDRDEIRRMRWRFKHKDGASRRRRYGPKAKPPDIMEATDQALARALDSREAR
jgi:hypothetical protein